MLIDSPSEQFAVDLFSRITVTIPDLYISSDFEVGYIEHQWLCGTGQTVVTRIALEPTVAISADKWQFPAIVGRTTILTDT